MLSIRFLFNWPRGVTGCQSPFASSVIPTTRINAHAIHPPSSSGANPASRRPCQFSRPYIDPRRSGLLRALLAGALPSQRAHTRLGRTTATLDRPVATQRPVLGNSVLMAVRKLGQFACSMWARRPTVSYLEAGCQPPAARPVGIDISRQREGLTRQADVDQFLKSKHNHK